MLDKDIYFLDNCRNKFLFLHLINKIYNLNKDFFMKNKFNSIFMPGKDYELCEYGFDLFEDFFDTVNIDYAYKNHYYNTNGKEYEPTEEELYYDEPDSTSTIFFIDEYKLYMHLYNHILDSLSIPKSIKDKVSFIHNKYEQVWIDLNRDFDRFNSSIYDYTDDNGIICGVALNNEFMVCDLSAVFMVLGIYIQVLSLIPIYKSVFRKYRINHNFIKKDGNISVNN